MFLLRIWTWVFKRKTKKVCVILFSIYLIQLAVWTDTQQLIGDLDVSTPIHGVTCDILVGAQKTHLCWCSHLLIFIHLFFNRYLTKYIRYLYILSNRRSLGIRMVCWENVLNIFLYSILKNSNQYFGTINQSFSRFHPSMRHIYQSKYCFVYFFLYIESIEIYRGISTGLTM